MEEGVATFMPPSPNENNWLSLEEGPIHLGEILDWVVTPACGAFVSFAGTVRDHSPGREGVESLDYECYPRAALSVLASIAERARNHWPMIGRLAIVHRLGLCVLEEVAVVVVVSTPSRADAFEAARFCIDRVKTDAPIWKRETWRDGSDWSTCAQPLDTAAMGRGAETGNR